MMVEYPYRVLYQKGSDIHTWEYRDIRCAERDYDKQTDFDKVMLLHILPNNVKCIKQKPLVDAKVKRAKSNKRSRV
jgi:hypothetical protein